MSDMMKLNPEKIAEAIDIIEAAIGEKSLEKIQERAVIVKSAADSSYKDDLIRCEKVNEQNYNATLPLVRTVRENFLEVKGVAEALSKRQLQTTKSREADVTINRMDAVSALRPQ